MKQIQYISTISLALLFALHLSGCSEKDEPSTNESERGIAIESITAKLQGMESGQEANTRDTSPGFSVNTDKDPTKKAPHERGWMMDFVLYNGVNVYPEGSFTVQNFNDATWTVTDNKYFPNYKKPQAEARIYPNNWSGIDTAQDTADALLAQDVLVKAKGVVEVAHKCSIQVSHKHSMLDFVIKDVVKDDISQVEVFIGTTSYTPFLVKGNAVNGSTTIFDMEYMVILPEDTKVSPVVQIKTKTSTTTGIKTITYKQTIDIIKDKKKELGSNKCYCFTLQGAKLQISPITVLNWASGESLPGEYIAVTAYPTFKAAGNEDKTFYFYYDSKLKEDGKPKLQEIKFNKNAECTIKPDGRILTHIYKADDVENISTTSHNMTPKANATPTQKPDIVLGQMIIELIIN